ncbi:MAG: N-acetyltransferase family protein [Candidatus Limnocylindrales bacterium]|jgi:phosphinothricin acetyltransferase
MRPEWSQSNRTAADGWVIRDAIPETDAEPCLAVYAPFVRDTAVSFEEIVPTVDEFRDRIRAANATHAWLVLEVAGRVVGYAYATPHRARAAYRWAADVTVYIAPEHRGFGGGRLLYERLLERLRRQGFQVLCAGVTLPNESSVGLHRAMGFEPVGVYRRIGWKAGAWHDVSWWQLELAPPTTTAPNELLNPARNR